jgi:hypothetical protein
MRHECERDGYDDWCPACLYEQGIKWKDKATEHYYRREWNESKVASQAAQTFLRAAELMVRFYA